MTKFSNFKLGTLSILLATTVAISAPINTAQAAQKGYTNYISDSIEVPLRRGAGYKYKISRMLKSGDPVKILEVNKKGWAQVQYQRSGKTHTGWLPTILLQNQPVAIDRLATQIKKTTEVEEKYNTLEQELTTLRTRFEETDAILDFLKIIRKNNKIYSFKKRFLKHK